MSRKKKEVLCKKCNLLEAEVYVRFPVSTIDKNAVKQYCELQSETTENGIVEQYVNVDYPITPESVNSYADSADYRKNPDVVKNATARQNLGDISEVQKVMSQDMTAMREMYARMQEVARKIEAYEKNKQSSTSAAEEKVESEVVSNG